MTKIPSIEEMLAAGMHFGHRTSKWHPKMKPYIFGSRKGVHIIDLEKSQKKLEEAMNFISEQIAQNKNVLLVGTKAQVKHNLAKAAKDNDLPYVTERWLGGTLTNFPVIRRSIKKYIDLVDKKAAGKLAKYTKKEQLEFDREIARLEEAVGGLVGLKKLPEVVFIWDIKEEETALREAAKRKIPVVAVCDTNTNPETVDYVIPANDDASKTIKLVIDVLDAAIKDGKSKAETNKQTKQKSNK